MQLITRQVLGAIPCPKIENMFPEPLLFREQLKLLLNVVMSMGHYPKPMVTNIGHLLQKKVFGFLANVRILFIKMTLTKITFVVQNADLTINCLVVKGLNCFLTMGRMRLLKLQYQVMIHLILLIIRNT